MYTYNVWVRINQTQTVNVRIQADNDYSCKQIAEAQYGSGNVLNYTRIDEWVQRSLSEVLYSQED